jgi:guanylate kinase
LVINDNFEQAHEDLLSVIRANRQDRARQMQRPEVAALINLE